MALTALLVPSRLKGLIAAILVSGLSASAIIYLTASYRPDSPPGYEPENSKRYVREMELYGGKANVLASDFREWFASLWRGRTLAFTVAVITVLLALAVLFFGLPLPPATSSSPGNRGQPGATDDL